MNKKSPSLIAAVVVLALAIPSMANAAEATYPADTRAPVGQEFAMTGKNIILKTASVGNLVCETLNLNAKISVNNGTTMTASGNNVEPTQAGCYGREKVNPLKVTSVNITQLNFTGTNGPSGATKSGTISLTVTVDVFGIMCSFTGTNVPVSSVSGQSPANVNSTDTGGHIVSTGGCGSATLSGSFQLHGPSGSTSPVVLH